MTPGPSPHDLAELYDAIGRRLLIGATASERDAMDAVSHVALAVVPGTQSASVTRGWNGRFTTIGQTDERAALADSIQYEVGSGPCVDAAVHDTIFRVDDLRQDERWPEFAARAYVQAGIISMLSYRLYFESEQHTAALNLYSTEPSAFDEQSQTLGLLVATHGALAITAARASETVSNLTVALDSNRRIGVAVGILVHQYKVTAEQGFELLRIASQKGNRKLVDIAADVTTTGELPLRPHPEPQIGDA